MRFMIYLGFGSFVEFQPFLIGCTFCFLKSGTICWTCDITANGVNEHLVLHTRK